MSLFFLLSTALYGLDHSAWNALLKKYVTPQHRVEYQQLKQHDLAALDAYLSRLAQPWPASLSANDEKAALINAYNALTIRWILTNYPTVSIWKTKKPFREPRHTLDAKPISLDEIETRLRNMQDPRIHAALVCAARSCPPLRREAYIPQKLDQQLADNTRAWLANPTLNSFDPATGKAQISMIFKWYKSDFPSIDEFLSTHAPLAARPKIDYKPYHWGLNDSSTLGESYSTTSFYLDVLRNR